MHDLTDAIAAAHAALDERFYPGPTEEMVACIAEAAAPIIAAKAWGEGHRARWRRGPDECRCSAWSSSECACGEYGTGALLSLADNPYRTPKETP